MIHTYDPQAYTNQYLAKFDPYYYLWGNVKGARTTLNLDSMT